LLRNHLAPEALPGGGLCSVDAIGPAVCGGKPGKAGESIHSLKDLLDHRRLTIDEVLIWASAIAAELRAIHMLGQGHGGVSAGNVCIEGNGAHLERALGHACADQPQDIVQFAALLREMLDNVQVEAGAAHAQWRALDRIAITNLRAGPGSRMKKVASAIRLLCATRKIEISARIELPPGEPVREPEPAPHRPRILMLVREVPPAAQANPDRAFANTAHVYAFLASAASIAAIACRMLLRFVR